MTQSKMRCFLAVRARYGTGDFLKLNIGSYEVRTKPPPYLFNLLKLSENGFLLLIGVFTPLTPKAL